MKKALFICYGGGHADALIPVMKYLIKDSDIQVDAIGINLAAEKLRQNGIPCKGLSNYLDVRSVEIGFPLAKTRHNFSSTVSFADSIAYYGYCMSDLIDEVGADAAYQILEVFDRRTMFPAKTMLKILQKEAPDVVVTTTMNRFEAAALYAASMLGIASLKVEDLIGRINRTFPDKIQVETNEERERLIANGIQPQQIILKSILKSPIVMDYCNHVYQRQIDTRPTGFAVLCEYAKNEIKKRGIAPDSIYITGQPAFDQHPWYLEHTDRNVVCMELGLSSDKSIVTFMSQPNEEREAVFKTLIAAAKKIDVNKVHVVVKLHPNEDGKIQQLIMDEENIHTFKLVKNIDARELLAISDLVITVSSTTGLEAAVMGKPLVYINVTDKEDYIPFADMGIGIRCSSSEELAEQLQRILIDKNAPVLKNTAEYKTDGKAAVRVGKLVRDFAEKNFCYAHKVIAIIQARMGSTRLPGKVMKGICGKPQIQHVIDRVSKSAFISKVVVATSVDAGNEPLKEYLTKNNISWYEGDENDVLSRFVSVGEKYNADIVVRVTADNPLCDAECIDKMVISHIQTNSDYTMMKGLPVGVAGEVINFKVLEEISALPDTTERDREHVTIYAYEHPGRYKINYMPAPLEYNYPEISLTVDTMDDFNRMSDIFAHCYHNDEILLTDVIRYINN